MSAKARLAAYSDPLGCTSNYCARLTSSKEELAMVERAVTLISDSAFAHSEEGLPLAKAISKMHKDGRINVWSRREPVHSRFSGRFGIMINRHYQPQLTAHLMAVAIVHEATHAEEEDTSLHEEYQAYFYMLDFYEEIRGNFRGPKAELEYLRELRVSDKFKQTIDCDRIYLYACI